MRLFPPRPFRGIPPGGAVWLLAAGIAVAAAGPAGDDALVREASWTPPDAAAVRGRFLDWIRSALPAGQAADTAAARATAAWEAVGGPEGADRLDAVVATVAAGDPRAESLAASPSRDGLAWLGDPGLPAFVRDAVRLWWARELVQRDRFDEALPILVELDVAASVDPAALLFYRAACQHWLLDTDGAVESIDRLLEREAEIPARYARVARLLRADAVALDRESLDHVARRMRDVRRRLELGRAGASTREAQDGVVAALDRLIEKLEDHEQGDDDAAGASAAGGGGAGQGAAGRPMDDSRIAGTRGAGEVRSRELMPGETWGDLPPHERDQALQQIGREFPPHYREAIEEYFKRLATGREER
jgi:hypothetical protein